MLAEPTPTTAAAMIGELDALVGRPLSVDESLSQFITDNELAWLDSTIPPEFW